MDIEKEDISKLKSDFLNIRAKKRLSKNDSDKLIADITGLLGIYAFDKKNEIAGLIEEMLSFAEKKKIAVSGSRIEFEKLKI